MYLNLPDDGDLNFDVEKLPSDDRHGVDSSDGGMGDNSLAAFVSSRASTAHRVNNFEDMNSRNSRRVEEN